jgi:NodT family efflux transporter outer membrane factor (OMF) lipoprotein
MRPEKDGYGREPEGPAMESTVQRAGSVGRSPALAPWLCVALTVSACQFAPPLRTPPVPTRARYTAVPILATADRSAPTRISAQRFVYGAQLAQPWWHAFHSARLDALVEEALQHSPTVAAAEAELRVARANVQLSQAVLYPQAGLALGASRGKNSGANFGGHLPGSTFSLYTGNVAVSYYPDFFGINRLLYRGSAAQMHAQQAALAAARLSLAGNVVDAAFGVAAAAAQLNASNAAIAAERRLQRLVEAQYLGGTVSYASVLTQRAQLAASESQLPPLRQQLAAYHHLLAVLLGHAPSERRARDFALNEFALPRRIPVALPSTLLRQRPDIRIAVEQMRYALTGIGIAKAQFYPLVTLTAAGGSSALTPGGLFNGSSTVWSIGGALAQPLLEGGKLRAQERSAYATYDAVRASYRATVLGAFQQVADALRALQNDGAAARDQDRARQALCAQVRLAEAGYRSGATDQSTVLLATVDCQNARAAWARLTATRLQDTAALFIALGAARWPRSAPGAARQEPPR